MTVVQSYSVHHCIGSCVWKVNSTANPFLVRHRTVSRRTVAIMEPKISWVARQLQLQHYVDDDGRKIELKKGVYAVKLDDLVATGAEAGGMTQAADDYEDEEAHDDDEDDGFIAPHDTEEAGDEPEANEDLDDDGDDEEEEEEEFQSAIPPSSSSLAPADD